MLRGQPQDDQRTRREARERETERERRRRRACVGAMGRVFCRVTCEIVRRNNTYHKVSDQGVNLVSVSTVLRQAGQESLELAQPLGSAALTKDGLQISLTRHGPSCVQSRPCMFRATVGGESEAPKKT